MKRELSEQKERDPLRALYNELSRLQQVELTLDCAYNELDTQVRQRDRDMEIAVKRQQIRNGTVCTMMGVTSEDIGDIRNKIKQGKKQQREEVARLREELTRANAEAGKKEKECKEVELRVRLAKI